MSKDKFKGFLSGIIVTTMVLALSVTAFAAVGNQSITVGYNNIKVYINEKLTTMKDPNGNTVEPFTYNGTTFVPLRAVGEALGQEVGWDGSTASIYIGSQPKKTGTSASEQKTFELTAGNYTAGEDIPAGTYTITVLKGSGNVYSTNAYSGGLNEIMGDRDANLGVANALYTEEYKNASFPDGVTLTITDDLKIKLTKTK